MLDQKTVCCKKSRTIHNQECIKSKSNFHYTPFVRSTTFGRGKKGADNKGATKRAQNKKGAGKKGAEQKGRRAKRAQSKKGAEQKGRRTKRARDHDVASPLHSRS